MLLLLALLLTLVIAFAARYGGLLITRALVDSESNPSAAAFSIGLSTVAGLLTAALWRVLSRSDARIIACCGSSSRGLSSSCRHAWMW